jgi:uncharacterized protein YbaR (Trm112 family)
VIRVTDFPSRLCYRVDVALEEHFPAWKRGPCHEAIAPTRESKEGNMATQLIDREITASQKEHEGTPQPYRIYACPTCKRELEPGREELDCRVCAVTYPIIDGIPDFLVEKLEESSSRDLRVIAKWDSSILLDFLARSYEEYIYPQCVTCSAAGAARP